MLAVDDALDVIYLGSFFFGVIFAAASLLFGTIDIGGDSDGDIGPVNLSTILAFVAWFGGVGYLIRHGFGGAVALSLVLASVAGLAGGAAIFWVLAKVVAPADRALDPKDYHLPGTLGRVSSSIREGGTGEVIYEQQGIRQVMAARSEDGVAIPRGAEVVIMRSEHGIAFVKQWDELMEGSPPELEELGAARADPEHVMRT